MGGGGQKGGPFMRNYPKSGFLLVKQRVSKCEPFLTSDLSLFFCSFGAVMERLVSGFSCTPPSHMS